MFRDPHKKLAFLIAITALAACTQKKTETSDGPIRKTPATGYESAAPNGLPDWIPIYPGSRVNNIETHNAGYESYTEFRLEAPDDCEKVDNWYVEKLRLAGFDINVPYECGPFGGEGPGNTRAIALLGGLAHEGPGSTFRIRATVRASSGQTDKSPIPDWVPQYPRSTPSNVVSTNDGERRIVFNFSTSDSAQAVVDWYQQKLKQAQFTIVRSGVSAAGAQMTAQDSAGWLILNLRMEPAGNTHVVSIEARELRH